MKARLLSLSGTAIAVAAIAAAIVSLASAGTYTPGGVGCGQADGFQTVRITAFAPAVRATNRTAYLDTETVAWRFSVIADNSDNLTSAYYTKWGPSTWYYTTANDYSSTNVFTVNGGRYNNTYIDLYRTSGERLWVYNEVTFFVNGAWTPIKGFYSTSTSTSQNTAGFGSC